MLAPDDLRTLGERLRARFDILSDAEFAVEIDPRRLTRATVDALAAIGVNRASLGVQDVNPEVQRAINRWQPFTVVERVVDRLRDAGISGINFDLMYGLPRQTVGGVLQSVEAALRCAGAGCAVRLRACALDEAPSASDRRERLAGAAGARGPVRGRVRPARRRRLRGDRPRSFRAARRQSRARAAARAPAPQLPGLHHRYGSSAARLQAGDRQHAPGLRAERRAHASVSQSNPSRTFRHRARHCARERGSRAQVDHRAPHATWPPTSTVRPGASRPSWRRSSRSSRTAWSTSRPARSASAPRAGHWRAPYARCSTRISPRTPRGIRAQCDMGARFPSRVARRQS